MTKVNFPFFILLHKRANPILPSPPRVLSLWLNRVKDSTNPYQWVSYLFLLAEEVCEMNYDWQLALRGGLSTEYCFSCTGTPYCVLIARTPGPGPYTRYDKEKRN